MDPTQTAPLSDADHTVALTAQWLSNEGYHYAAAVLEAVIRRHPIVWLSDLRANEGELKRLLDVGGEAQCRVYSGEHRLYWRPKCSGYTSSALEAGIFTFWAAYAATSHCGPEKEIGYEMLPSSDGVGSGWKS
jgi:putative component of membrane protein insertase Oxa1/YidC/SpoIIIJ protein YidD